MMLSARALRHVEFGASNRILHHPFPLSTSIPEHE
jgi:hypothetical protein